MNLLYEAKEIMQATGCIKAFPIYDIQLTNIAEIKNCHENGKSIELEKEISKLLPNFTQELKINKEKPITCPIYHSLNKYLEFSLKNKQINTCNLNFYEFKQIENKINPLLKKQVNNMAEKDYSPEYIRKIVAMLKKHEEEMNRSVL